MYRAVKRIIKDESGSVALNYGVIGAGIVLAFVAVLSLLGSELKHMAAKSKHTIHSEDKVSS